jgi:hypothetical protein
VVAASRDRITHESWPYEGNDLAGRNFLYMIKAGSVQGRPGGGDAACVHGALSAGLRANSSSGESSMMVRLYAQHTRYKQR